MTENYFYLKRIRLLKTVLKTFFLCLALLLAIQSGKAEDLYNVGSLNNVTISQGGYMEVDVPVYDCDYSDEAVHEGVFYLSVGGNNYDLFYWSSQDAYDKWQNDSGHHSHWAKFKRNGNNTAAVLVSGNSIETYYKGGINTGQHTDGSVTHRVTVYLSENLLETYMGKQVTIYTTVDIDENGDDSNGGINGGKSADKTMPNWSNPTVMTPNFSNEVGKYDVVWTVTNAPANSQYRWNGIGDWQTSTSGTTNKFDVSNTQQTCNLQFQYRISDYQRITTSASVILPAYQQPLNFTASDFTPDNGDTKLSWNVAPSQTSQQTGDAFEIQRSADPGFATAITVGTINYDPSKTSYELTDKTSDENLNGKVYYRIRRTKASAWQWSFCKTTDIEKKMSHKGIRDESVLVGIDDNNKALVTWDFDEGNVASDNSQIIVERVNLITQQKDKIALPYAATTMSYEEELTAMCQEFMYNIYIVPGNSKYSTQEPVPSQLKDSERRIIPLNLGTVPVIRASKGYFSDRVELEWELSDGAIETFAITRRLCGSMDEFKQIDTQASYEASKAYTYSDVTGIPGQLYEYRITGLTNCADGVHETYSSVTIGFRTPTGDIYGRVTFENGQAVENVEINVETEENIRSKSLAFTSGSFASISNKDLLKNNLDAITLQAWIAPDATTGLQKVISKDGMYELGIDNNRFYFKAGTETLKTDTLSVTDVKDGGDFMHLTGVYDGNRLLIYINGQLIARTTTSVAMTGNDNPVQFGGGVFKGIIDEVRIWSSDLTAEEIKRDYNRYLTGGEKSLLAYYTFNYAVNTEFYDISFEGTEYNENHGTFGAGVTLSDNVPPVDQLGYRGVTAADGSYSVRSIPYQGNGTAYRIIPRMGIHAFESEQEVRFIGQGAQSHTVNFTDKSSFKVTGWVTYENSTIPVQGVGFNVDGKAVLKSNGIPEETDATGRFEIRVPVGTHEVKATKANHTFVNDGRITDQYGLDLNYQDEVLGVELEDNTTIKYIGRVAGGAEQEAFPIGHSLSTNNLAEGITVTLTYSNQAYTFDSRTLTEEHFKPSNKNKAHVNEVVYAPDQNHKNDIVIHVNDTTGEFVAHVIPERFNVTVNAGYHTSIPGSGSEINLSQQSIIREEVYEYTDSIMDDGNWIRSHYSDIVTYQFSQKFIKRYSPEIRITQLDKKNVPLPYFGLDTVRIANMIGQTDTIPLYNGTSYTFGRPVFQQHEDYTLQMEIFEKYAHYKADGNESGKIDEVPTSDATFKFNNEIANSDSKEV
jgi:hypothetical protein